MASIDGHVEVAKILLHATGIDANPFDDDNVTPLILAAENDHLDLMNVLLEQPDTQVNHCTAGDGASALHVAAIEGHEEIVERLLAVPGIDVNLADSENGYTALHLAVLEGHDTIMYLLLETKEINIEATDSFGDTTFMTVGAFTFKCSDTLFFCTGSIAYQHSARLSLYIYQCCPLPLLVLPIACGAWRTWVKGKT